MTEPSINKDTVTAIAEIATDASAKRAEGRTINAEHSEGRRVVWGLERDASGGEKFRELVPANDYPTAETLEVSTLAAIVGYLGVTQDHFAHAEEATDGKGDVTVDEVAIVHVVGPEQVDVVSPLRARRDREVFLTAKPTLGDALGGFEGKYLAQDDFVLKLQTLFVNDPERAELLKLVGNMTDEVQQVAADDGVTQIVTTRGGGARLASTMVKNPWTRVLRPRW